MKKLYLNYCENIFLSEKSLLKIKVLKLGEIVIPQSNLLFNVPGLEKLRLISCKNTTFDYNSFNRLKE